MTLLKSVSTIAKSESTTKMSINNFEDLNNNNNLNNQQHHFILQNQAGLNLVGGDGAQNIYFMMQTPIDIITSNSTIHNPNSPTSLKLKLSPTSYASTLLPSSNGPTTTITLSSPTALNNSSSSSGSPKIVRDERRRANHNEVERRRRDNINKWIVELSKVIPDCSTDQSKHGQVNNRNKASFCRII